MHAKTLGLVEIVALLLALLGPSECGAILPQYHGKKVSLPLILTADCDEDYASGFEPSGYMGYTHAIELDSCWKENPRSGNASLKCTFNSTRGWAGVVWQCPANDWGFEEGGLDLRGAKRVTFWARGDEGGEEVTFRLGILGIDKPYPDSGKASLGTVKLEKHWKRYTISLDRRDLKCIKTGFSWAVTATDEPITFYLDDIQYE